MNATMILKQINQYAKPVHTLESGLFAVSSDRTPEYWNDNVNSTYRAMSYKRLKVFQL